MKADNNREKRKRKIISIENNRSVKMKIWRKRRGEMAAAAARKSKWEDNNGGGIMASHQRMKANRIGIGGGGEIEITSWRNGEMAK
jgi:hypothetical protein